MNHLLRVTLLLFSAELPATLRCFFFFACYLSCFSVWGMKQVEEGNGHIGGWRTGRGRTARFGADTAKLILHRLITGWPPPARCLSSLFPNCHTPAVKHACLHTRNVLLSCSCFCFTVFPINFSSSPPACPGITPCFEITHNEIGIQPL